MCQKKIYVKREKSLIITKLYHFPPKLVVLVGPNKSMCNNYNGLEVETISLDLNDTFVCLPSWHASQILSFSKFNLGKLVTNSFLISFESECMLICEAYGAKVN